MTALDRESAEAYRTTSQVLYGLHSALESLERRIAALEEAAPDRPVPEDGP
jgi:hypothetical protein